MAAAGRQPAHRARHERLLAALLIATMVLGAAVVWIGVPIGGMWLAGELTDQFGLHLPLAMALILPGVTIGSLGLAWVNAVYLKVTGSRERTSGNLWRLRRHGPLEPILFVCFLVGLVALFVWFFLFAENPPRGVFGPGAG
jgi:hypothetical protein